MEKNRKDILCLIYVLRHVLRGLGGTYYGQRILQRGAVSGSHDVPDLFLFLFFARTLYTSAI